MFAYNCGLKSEWDELCEYSKGFIVHMWKPLGIDWVTIFGIYDDLLESSDDDPDDDSDSEY